MSRLAAFIAVLLLGASLSQTIAHEIASGNITVTHPFVRATPPGATTGGATWPSPIPLVKTTD
jgi:copper(I)-binding protein